MSDEMEMGGNVIHVNFGGKIKKEPVRTEPVIREAVEFRGVDSVLEELDEMQGQKYNSERDPKFRLVYSLADLYNSGLPRAKVVRGNNREVARVNCEVGGVPKELVLYQAPSGRLEIITE